MSRIKKTDTAETIVEVETSPRYSKNGQRRGKYRFAAPLGLVMILLAAVGVVSLIVWSVGVIRDARDTSGMKEDMYYTLLPLMKFTPAAFESADKSSQDALLQAAIYKITDAEWIKQKQDANYQTPFAYDDYGRVEIPVEQVEASYASLFGKSAKPQHHTFGKDLGEYFTYEYDAENKCYHAPSTADEAAYQPVVDTIRRAGDTYKVRVGYVHIQDITVDDRGNDVISPEKATYFQLYTVEKQEDGSFIILSVADEKEDK
jgi:hypothetical protein